MGITNGLFASHLTATQADVERGESAEPRWSDPIEDRPGHGGALELWRRHCQTCGIVTDVDVYGGAQFA
jgi:hypothetical protein